MLWPNYFRQIMIFINYINDSQSMISQVKMISLHKGKSYPLTFGYKFSVYVFMWTVGEQFGRKVIMTVVNFWGVIMTAFPWQRYSLSRRNCRSSCRYFRQPQAWRTAGRQARACEYCLRKYISTFDTWILSA